MTYVYPATIQKEADGRYSIWFEDLPGCATSGETLADAIDMARDAMGGWMDCAMSNGAPINPPRSTRDVPLESMQEVALVDMDLSAYRRENDARAIRKTVTLPAWLNTRAERAAINFSQTLQTALKEKLGAAD